MSSSKKHTLDHLTAEVEAYFNSLSYHKVTIMVYQKAWRRLKEFMEGHKIEFFDAKVGDAFVKSILNKKSYSDLSRKEKDIIRSANVLTEYQTTGMVRFRSVQKTYKFEGEIGKLIQAFLTFRRSQGMSNVTVNNNQLYLHRFWKYLNSEKVLSLSDFEKQHVLGFINRLGFQSKATIHCTLSSLRGFLRYLFDNQYLDYDLTYLIPKSSYKKEARLPTTYTKDEIERLLKAIDTGSPKGKRDKAMILLAARLGLRASDICGLQFENIHWETNTIHLVQKKTKEKIELSLLVEIGNSIIDYLKYGRAVSDLPYIFLRTGQPYDKLEEPTLHSIFSFYLKRAGISNIEQKKHGPHALRHSLAGILLEQKTPLPVISEVLGHSNTESTKTYLRIDLESLRQCALDVPIIQSPAYQEVI
jgi:integrase/recombinase XerD